MVDYVKLLEEINKTEVCVEATYDELSKKNKSFQFSGKYWEITTEITYNSKWQEIVLYLWFPEDFPYLLPKIYIDSLSLKDKGFIPHVNEDLSVCVFDEGINHLLDTTKLCGVLEYMISRVKNIITASTDASYLKEEFLREFRAYWGLSYSDSDKIAHYGFQTIEDHDRDKLKCIRFDDKRFYNYSFYLYDKDEDVDKIKNIAEDSKVSFEKVEILFIPNRFVEPPFDMTYTQALKIINSNIDIKEKFEYIVRNTDFKNILILFKHNKNELNEYYGWIFNNVRFLTRKQGGKRNTKNDVNLINLGYNKRKNVHRIIFDNLTPERLQKRTTGFVEQKYSVALTGLGSVGSNLVYYLKNLPIDTFRFVDNERLRVENINRHLLGLSFVDSFKSEALFSFLKSHNPLLDVDRKNESITNVLTRNIEFVNNCDYHILALGKTNIEIFVLDKYISGELDKPLFIFWVEPYLGSGQMIYMNPKDSFLIKQVLLNYKYHVIAKKENKHNETYIIEGSCQSGYYPYSATNLTQFISAVFPIVKDYIIKNKEQSSKIYSWIGDKSLLKNKGIALSKFGKKYDSFSLITNKL